MEKRESIVMKRGFFIIITIVVLIIIAISSVPFLLNSHAGRKTILSKLSKNTGYSLKAERTYFSWLGPQRAEMLTAIAPSNIEYKFPEISLDIPLWELYKEIPSIGVTQIFNPTVTIPTIHLQPHKEDPPADPIVISHEKCFLPRSCKVFGEIHVTDGKVYINEWQNSIDIPKFQYICNEEEMTLHIDAKFPNSESISNLAIECREQAQNVQLQGSVIPSNLVDLFVKPWKGISLEEILGPTFDIESNAQLVNKLGPFLFNLHSSKASISQSGSLYSEYYRLDNPLTISMQLSQKVIDAIFPHSVLQIDPIQRPITIIISPQEICLPLSVSTEFKDGFIHIGKITCTNKNLLFDITAQILGIHDPKIDLWFSDIPISYVDGILRISRFEIVVQNKYPLAMWGKIDYVQKKVNLTLAITESTLRKVFGITSLPVDYVITCPIKGSFDDIQLDIGKLVKRLSILVAKEKTKKQLWKEGTNFFQEPIIEPPPIQTIPWGN